MHTVSAGKDTYYWTKSCMFFQWIDRPDKFDSSIRLFPHLYNIYSWPPLQTINVYFSLTHIAPHYQQHCVHSILSSSLIMTVAAKLSHPLTQDLASSYSTAEKNYQQTKSLLFFLKREILLISSTIHQGDTSSWNFPDHWQTDTQPKRVWQRAFDTNDCQSQD